MWARDRSFVAMWWAGRESNPHSRRRLIYSQRSSPPAQPTHMRLRRRTETAVSWWVRRPIDERWSRRRDSNPEPAVYKTAALPIELRRHDGQGHTADDPFRRRGMIGPGGPTGQARGVRVALGLAGFGGSGAGWGFGPPGRRSSSGSASGWVAVMSELCPSSGEVASAAS